MPINRDEYRRLHDQGWGCDRLAEHFGVSKRYACRVRKKLGLPAHDHRKALSPRFDEALARYRDGGISIVKCERAFGLRSNELHTYLRREREGRKTPETPPPEVHAASTLTPPAPTSCADCGSPIEQLPRRPVRHYCDRGCQQRAYRKRHPEPPRKVCPTWCACCGKRLPQPKTLVGGPRLYCNQRCQQKASRERCLPPPRHSCEWCGVPFEAPRRDKRFCCDAHRPRARDERKRRPPPPSPRELLVLAVGWPGAAAQWPDPDRVGMGPQWRKKRAA